MPKSEDSFGWETDEESVNGNIDIKEEILTPQKDEDSFEERDDFKVIRKSAMRKILSDSDDSGKNEKLSYIIKKEASSPKNSPSKMPISTQRRSIQNYDSSSDNSDKDKNLSNISKLSSSSLKKSPSKSSKSTVRKSVQNHTIKKELVTDNDDDNDNDDDEEEIWGFQCPKELNISSLENINFFNNTNKIKINGKTYEFQFKKYEDKRKINIIFPDLPDRDKIKTYDFNGYIHMHDKIKPPNLIELLPEEKTIVKFPSNLKTRHPLLGANYKSISKLPSNIREKLNDISKCVKLKSKVKTEIKIEETETPTPRKKKRKHEESLSENISNKKIKIENSNDWLSEQSIEQSLFNSTPKTVKIKKEKN